MTVKEVREIISKTQISHTKGVRVEQALNDALDFIEWLIAKGIITSSASSMSSICLEKIYKRFLNE